VGWSAWLVLLGAAVRLQIAERGLTLRLRRSALRLVVSGAG
jgi:hypothetical protein